MEEVLDYFFFYYSQIYNVYIKEGVPKVGPGGLTWPSKGFDLAHQGWCFVTEKAYHCFNLHWQWNVLTYSAEEEPHIKQPTALTHGVHIKFENNKRKHR